MELISTMNIMEIDVGGGKVVIGGVILGEVVVMTIGVGRVVGLFVGTEPVTVGLNKREVGISECR